MFCNSDICESAIGVSERPSGPSIMEPFYFLQGPFPLFTGVRGRQILRSSLRAVVAGIMIAQIPQHEERKAGDEEDAHSKTGRAAPSQEAGGVQASVDRGHGPRGFGSRRDGDRGS